jgi:hypothetical protein
LPSPLNLPSFIELSISSIFNQTELDFFVVCLNFSFSSFQKADLMSGTSLISNCPKFILFIRIAFEPSRFASSLTLSAFCLSLFISVSFAHFYPFIFSLTKQAEQFIDVFAKFISSFLSFR